MEGWREGERGGERGEKGEERREKSEERTEERLKKRATTPRMPMMLIVPRATCLQLTAQRLLSCV